MRGTSSWRPVPGLTALLLAAAVALAIPLASLGDAAAAPFPSLTTEEGDPGLEEPSQERMATMFLLLFMSSLVGLYIANRHLRRKGTGYSLEAPGSPLAKPERVPDLEGGESYLVTQGQSRALKVFTQELKKGEPGLLISRTHPDKLKGSWDLEGAKLHWLTDGEVTERGAVRSLEELRARVQKFLDGGKKGVVLLDGLEYLFVQYSFTEVMKLLETLRDLMTATGSNLLIPLDLLALVKRQRALLTREFRQL